MALQPRSPLCLFEILKNVAKDHSILILFKVAEKVYGTYPRGDTSLWGKTGMCVSFGSLLTLKFIFWHWGLLLNSKFWYFSFFHFNIFIGKFIQQTKKI